MTDTNTTGTDVLREAVRVRMHKGHLAPLARDLQIAISDLEAFATSGGQLPVPILQALVKEIFNAEYDVDRDRLLPVNRQPPRSLGVRPPNFDPEQIPLQGAPPWASWMTPPERTKPVPQTQPGYSLKRSGWAK